ncbi:MAG: HisA/HisF-related TIM barrel protein, partial [Sphingomonadales bacterium]
MLAKRIIPCLDVRRGLVVKGVKFRNHKPVGDILELAERYSAEGADELVFYDITASADGKTIDLKWVYQVARLINIPFTVAGGIRTVKDAGKKLENGADKISINSPALQNPDLID